jgi:hypothetical protein
MKKLNFNGSTPTFAECSKVYVLSHSPFVIKEYDVEAKVKVKDGLKLKLKNFEIPVVVVDPLATGIYTPKCLICSSVYSLVDNSFFLLSTLTRELEAMGKVFPNSVINL